MTPDNGPLPAERIHPGRLDSRVALVTGAGHGIGEAIARRFADEGAAVVVNDVDAAGALATVAAIVHAGGRASASVGDVASVAATDAMVAEAEARFGGLDVLVNNAGIVRSAATHEMTDGQWNGVVDVILKGTFNAVRSAAHLLRRSDGDEIAHHRKVLMISSIAGVYGGRGGVNYSAAKAGVIGLTRALAREWAPQRINVNAIAPGRIVGTSMGSGIGAAGDPDDVVARVDASMPMGRAGRPEDVAALAAFLCSAESDFLTGQVIELHGGAEILPPKLS